MAFCTTCGGKLEGAGIFCGACGAPVNRPAADVGPLRTAPAAARVARAITAAPPSLPVAVATQRCPRCQTLAAADATACTCGHRFVPSAPAWAATETYDAFVSSPTLDALLGRQQRRYREKFAALVLKANIGDMALTDDPATQQLARVTSWNWSGFLGGPYWAAYRRLHAGGPANENPFVLVPAIMLLAFVLDIVLPDLPSELVTLSLNAIYGLRGTGMVLNASRRRHLAGDRSPATSAAAAWVLMALALVLAIVGGIAVTAIRGQS